MLNVSPKELIKIADSLDEVADQVFNSTLAAPAARPIWNASGRLRVLATQPPKAPVEADQDLETAIDRVEEYLEELGPDPQTNREEFEAQGINFLRLDDLRLIVGALKEKLA